MYFLVFSMPGDPIAALGGNKPLSPAVQDRLRAEYNLDEPFIVQYLLYLQGLVQGDFGTTFAGRPVIDDIRSAFPVTARLALVAITFEAILGIIGGVIAGLRKGTWIDSTLLVTSIMVIAVPTFVIGFVAQFVFGVQLGWVTINVGANVTWQNLLLPGMVLGAVSFAYVLRLTRTQITETMTADHVRTATAKGLSRPRVITVHILRNSLIPVVTFLGVDLGQLMGGAIVTEGIFNIPGLGFHLFDAIQRGESTKMVSMVTLLVIIFIISNLLIDLLYALLDPRIRYDARK